MVITRENFKKEVMESDKPVLLDFWASWCGPCSMLSPVMAEIEKECDGSFKVGKVNVDEQSELANAFRVQSIPMLCVVKNGEITAQSVGYQPKDSVLALLKK